MKMFARPEPLPSGVPSHPELPYPGSDHANRKETRMKRITLAAIISLTVLTAACHKKVPPPTAQSPSPAPSAAAPDTPKPVATTTRPAATPKETAPVKQAQTMTPAERQPLNEALARPEDALFDFDKST